MGKPLALVRRLTRRARRFPGSEAYWEERYARGGTSGCGSYGEFAVAKAGIINRLISEHDIRSIVEFGCGDGNQLSLLDVPEYIGLDVSPTAVRMCIERFADDSHKSFFRYSPELHSDSGGVFRRDTSLSIEVIFHLVEDPVFDRYMRHLFDSAERFVIICAADLDWSVGPHERHRQFSGWIAEHARDWRQVDMIPSPQPYDAATDSGFLSDFFLFGRW